MQVPPGSRWRAWCTTRCTARSGRRSRRCPTRTRSSAYLRPRQHGGDAEPGGGRRAGGAALEDAGSAVRGALPGRRRDRVRRRAEANPDCPRRARGSRAAAPTATATSRTTSTGRPPSCSSPPGKPDYRDDLEQSRFHAPKRGAAAAAGAASAGITSRPLGKMSLAVAPERAGRCRRSPTGARSRSSRPRTASLAAIASAATACRWRPTSVTSGARTAAC